MPKIQAATSRSEAIPKKSLKPGVNMRERNMRGPTS
jgi:hypothetical protein